MSEENAEEVLRRARRAVAKATHPDLGGDLETHRRAMEALDAAGAPQPADPLIVVKRRLRDVVALPKNIRQAFQEGRESDPDEPDA